MPCYPAFALLIGSAMAMDSKWIRGGTRVLTVVAAGCAVAAIAILVAVWRLPVSGDISNALSRNPSAYKLSLGHMEDLTLQSFAYLRPPLVLAALAFLVGAIGTVRANKRYVFVAAALMMVLFFHAARLAMVTFDPYLSSRPLAELLERSPEGTLIVYRHYYPTSSVFFYTNRTALLLNGRLNNLVYGSYAPGAPDVFIDDSQFRELWRGPKRNYLVAPEEVIPSIRQLVDDQGWNVVASSGGKVLLTNQPLPANTSR